MFEETVFETKKMQQLRLVQGKLRTCLQAENCACFFSPNWEMTNDSCGCFLIFAGIIVKENEETIFLSEIFCVWLSKI